jgi:hypothetical protein
VWAYGLRLLPDYVALGCLAFLEGCFCNIESAITFGASVLLVARVVPAAPMPQSPVLASENVPQNRFLTAIIATAAFSSAKLTIKETNTQATISLNVFR